MGSLRHLPIAQIVQRYHCQTLFETGTGLGQSLQYAQQLPFRQLISCEINDDLYTLLSQIYAPLRHSERLQLLHCDSARALQRVLPELNDAPVLFWLDAHYPGADFGLNQYDDEPQEHIRLPLEQELQLIAKLRPNHKDVLIIDDLRIYEDGPFANGPAPASDRLPRFNRNLQLLEQLFAKTHHIFRSYQDEGYLLVVPRVLSESSIQLPFEPSAAFSEAHLAQLRLAFSATEHPLQLFEQALPWLVKHLQQSSLQALAQPWQQLLEQLAAKPLAVLGNGFYGALVAAICQQQGYDVAAFVSRDSKVVGRLLIGKPVLSVNGFLESPIDQALIASYGSAAAIYSAIVSQAVACHRDKALYWHRAD
ncbi:hypothetical protein [Celerinatantimonas yamalensis]|uniref:Methyltransferase family protein n=1 Tax=Celerinatantimonas yamalensis TaxID=559956 RepID=A0ABW9GD13_9GAMM